MQEQYYRSAGIAAWTHHSTPYFVTNSQVMAEAYAELLLALLQDHPMDPREPLYLLELGSGTGRLACNLMRELRRKLTYFPGLREQRVCLILSDIAESNVLFYESHPALLELGEGVDFCLHTPGQPLWLRRARRGLEGLLNPLVVLANYVFDSLAHDEFFLDQGQLAEVLIEVVPNAERPHSSPDRLDLRDAELRYHSRLVEDPQSYYSDPACAESLAHYLARIERGAFTIPVGALQVLGQLRQLAQLCLLSSDRSFVRRDSMVAYPNHPISQHHGSFSHMVNYDALGRTFSHYLHTSHHGLNEVHTVFCTDLAVPLPQLEYVFRERLDRANAINSSKALLAMARDETDVGSLLGVLKLNLNDPHALSVVAKKLSAFMSELPMGEQLDLLAALEEAWRLDYYFEGSPNVTMWLGNLYYMSGKAEQAAYFFELTVERTGEDERLRHLLGTCYEALGDPQRSRGNYLRALQLDPSLQESMDGLARLSSSCNMGPSPIL